MRLDNAELTKSIHEQYTFTFNPGERYLSFSITFTIANNGLLQSHSRLGWYSYRCHSFGDNFKKYLCGIDPSYLIGKVANKEDFDFDNYQKQAKFAIIQERKAGKINKEDARKLWNFFDNELKSYVNNSCDSYDTVCDEIYKNEILTKLYNGEVFNSNFAPEREYSSNAKLFAYEIFPQFVEILKSELEK